MTYVKNSAFINSKYQKIAFRMESLAYKVKRKTETSVTEKESYQLKISENYFQDGELSLQRKMYTMEQVTSNFL